MVVLGIEVGSDHGLRSPDAVLHVLHIGSGGSGFQLGVESFPYDIVHFSDKFMSRLVEGVRFVVYSSSCGFSCTGPFFWVVSSFLSDNPVQLSH